MSQSGYLVSAFVAVVLVLAVWVGIIALKLTRLRRDAALLDKTSGPSGG